MAKLPKAFKRKGHEAMKDFSAIPAGEYIVKITKADYKENSKKNGHYLAVTMTVQNKAHKGHNVFATLNLDNPSDKAVEIAESELATICDAIGKAVIKDTDELMGKMMIVKLTVKEDRNEVQMYSPMAQETSDLDDDDDDDAALDDDDNQYDSGDEVDADDVVELANKYKKLTNLKALKEVLGEYDISKTKDIAGLEEDDLESLMEDLEEAIEEEED